MVRLLCRLLTIWPGETRPIDPPSWTAHVGPEWDVVNRAPWNLYNAWWRFGQWVIARAMG